MIDPIGFDETDDEYTSRLEAEIAVLEQELTRLRNENSELAKHIDGCVRVAADALKRAEVAEARLTALVGGAR